LRFSTQDLDTRETVGPDLLGLVRQSSIDFRLSEVVPVLVGHHDVAACELLEKLLVRIAGAHRRLGDVEVDLGELELALVNIAVNARDAMPDGGTITLQARNVVLTPGSAAGALEGDFVALAIIDTGAGIPEDVLQRVFEPFYTTKKSGQGTGLGLATVYGIVKQSGGNIWVYSEEGHGTTFKIYFPRVTAEAEVVSGRRSCAEVSRTRASSWRPSRCSTTAHAAITSTSGGLERLVQHGVGVRQIALRIGQATRRQQCRHQQGLHLARPICRQEHHV